MFSKILTFGIGALALVQGALAIAEGRYVITNPEMGTLVSFNKGDPILLSRAPLPPPLGQWTVNQLGQEYTITNADASVYANEVTLFTGDRFDTFSIEDAGDDLFVVRLFYALSLSIRLICSRLGSRLATTCGLLNHIWNL
ncbi:hypothetical protein DFH08DRAFT_871041 [Mycena albidolilacea]|uniref:Uncharacterized protein n=1 Tax=Mycena albidolilacea TaxID=1033008 RepID=A0AAD6ZZ34_9AGAR|nr:hypothetical protein DFH08DRAFT_871041 [Mycena albidolilacea]